MQNNPTRRAIGWIFYVLNNIICFVYNLQTQMVVTLALSIWQIDAPALVFNNAILFNVLVV
jgi:hypothetical protein